MKKKLTLFIIFSFLIPSSFILADNVQTLPGNGLPKGVRSQKIERRNYKAEMEREKERNTNYENRENTLNRFNNHISRLNKFHERISTKTQKIQERGIDSSAAKQYLDSAKTKIDEAKIKISAIESIFSENNSNLSKESKAKVVTLSLEVNNLIKESQKDLLTAIGLLRSSIETSSTKTQTE